MAKPRNLHVVLRVDTTKLEAELRRTAALLADTSDVLEPLHRHLRNMAYQTRRAARTWWRSALTPGDAHIDRVCREILAGKPGRDAATRLLAAADLAAVLDRDIPTRERVAA